uniref:hypothetical protein n=1 Tax=Parerythrobacter lutipelagi TaxID=1964208 RepID=UPI00137607DA|nr:hypothetical protein [Parerythrobacter lutipelagi]
MRILAGGLLVSFLGLSLASAHDGNANASGFEGTYAGTFICSSGEMGMTVSLEDAGPATDETARNLCRSNSGQCYDEHKARSADMRQIEGVLNFFPTSSNPDAPAGAFRVHGAADTSMRPAYEIEMSPGSWIEQPGNFGSSAMVATLLDGEMVGKPTAPGCHILKLRKLKGL